jgi:hypothetical protein
MLGTCLMMNNSTQIQKKKGKRETNPDAKNEPKKKKGCDSKLVAKFVKIHKACIVAHKMSQ